MGLLVTLNYKNTSLEEISIAQMVSSTATMHTGATSSISCTESRLRPIRIHMGDIVILQISMNKCSLQKLHVCVSYLAWHAKNEVNRELF